MSKGKAVAYLNESYNPDWEAIYDHHHEQRTLLQEKIDCQLPYEEFKALNDKWIFHHDTCLRCLEILQHKTVQDYAHWLFYNTFPSLDKIDLPPYENFKTMEQAKQACDQIASRVEKKQKLERCRAKPGRPDNLDIFEKKGNNRLYTNWRHYILEDFRGRALPDMVTLVTVDDRGSVKHVCFYCDKHEDRKFVLPLLKNLISAFIAEDTGLPYADYCDRINRCEKKQWFKWPRKQQNTKPLPEYHFYVHHMSSSVFGETLHKFEVCHEWYADYPRDRAHPQSVLASETYDEIIPETLMKAVDDYIGFEDVCP